MIETLFAMDPLLILSFMGTGVLLNLTPGADVVFASACGVSGGWRCGVAAAFGITMGSVVHIVLAALGVSAALIAIPHAYDIIRYAGAGYLGYLAVKSWRSDPALVEANGERILIRAVKRGLVTNVFNPKVALFILAFLPQFVDPLVGPIWHQIVILGALFSATGLIITSGYGALGGVFGNFLKRANGALTKITAIVFGGLAVRLVLE